jgi:ABC-type branched-subunit amino acid transport system permease subunit
MSTINGLPAHVLLVHIIVVLVPLAAVLAIVCALWPAARRRLIWFLVALSAFSVVMTPITTDAGEWLEHKIGRSPAVNTHAELGDTMIYFALGLLVAVLLLLLVHLRETRNQPLGRALVGVVAVIAIAAGVAATVQVYRIGETGARATWGNQVATTSAG